MVNEIESRAAQPANCAVDEAIVYYTKSRENR